MADPIIKIKFDFKDVGTGVRIVKGDLESLDKAAEDTKQEFGRLEKSFEVLGIKASTLAARSRGAATGIRLLSNSVFDLLSNLRTHSEQIISTNRNMATMQKAMTSVDKSVKGTAAVFDDVANAMDKAGNKAVTLARRSRKAASDMRGLNNAIHNLVTSLKSQIDELNKTTKQINTNVKSFDKLEKALRKNAEAAEKSGKSYKKLNNNLGNVRTSGIALGSIFTSLISIQSIALVIQYADAWAKLSNNIRIFASSESELISIREELFRISQKTRTELGAQTALYNRLKIAQSDLNISEKSILKITEAVGYALGVTSTTALEARGALIQLGQAFGSGIVRAEEFNAINEGTPKIMQAVAKGLGLTRSQLRTLVLDGKVTSEAFSNSLLSMADSLEKEYANVNITVAQSITNIKTSLTRLVGEIGETTSAYKRFVDLLGGINNTLLNHNDGLKTVASAMVEITGLLLGSAGLVFGVKALTTAFGLLNTAVKANPLVAIATAVVAVGMGVSYAYENIFGAASKISEQNETAFNKLAESIERVNSLNISKDKKEQFFVSIMSQVDDLTEYLNKKQKEISFKIDILKKDMAIDFGDGLNGESKKRLQGLLSEQERLEGILKIISNQKQISLEKDKQSVTIAKEKAKIDAANYALLLKDAEKKQEQKKYYEDHRIELDRMKATLSEMAAYEKQRVSILKDGNKLVPAQVRQLEVIEEKLKGHNELQEKYNEMRKLAGKTTSTTDIAYKNQIDDANILIALDKKQRSEKVKLLKLQIEQGTTARKQRESAERSGLAVLASGRELIKQYKTIEDIGISATKSMIAMGEMPIGAYNVVDELNNRRKNATKELELYFKKLKSVRTGSIDFLEGKKKADERGTAYYGDMKKAEDAMTETIRENSMSQYKYRLYTINKFKEENEKMYPSLAKTIEEFAQSEKKALSPLNQYIMSIEDPIIAVENVFVSAMKGMEDSLVEFVKTGKLEWKSLVSSIIEGLLRIEIQQQTANLYNMFTSGGSSSLLSSAASFLFGASAKGNVFGNNGLQAFGSGGTFTNSIVSKPTMFAHGSGFGIMGEKGDEAILPLSRTSSGNLGVEASGMSSPTIVINIENNSGSDIEANQTSSSKEGENYILGIVLNAASNNGGFSRSLNGAMSKWR